MLTRRQNNSFRSFGETQTSFTCPNCGATGKYSDVIRTEDDTEKIRQAAKELVRQEENQEKEEAMRYLQKKQNEHKSPFYFSGSDTSSSEENNADNGNNTAIMLSVLFIIIAVLFISPLLLNYKPSDQSDPPYYARFATAQQERKLQGDQSPQASEICDLMNHVSAAVSRKDASGLMNYLYGAENYDWISVSDWESFLEDYYGEKWGNTLGLIEMTYNSGWPPPDNAFDNTEYAFLNDIDFADYAYLNDIKPYQIFDFKDTYGKVHTYAFYQNESGAWQLYFDYSGLIAPFCREALLETWNAVKDTALNYGDSSAIEKYSSENVTADQLNDLLCDVRSNLGKRNPYDNAELTKLTLTGYMNYKDYNIFDMGLTAEYQSQSSSHPEGSYTAKIRLEYRDSQWLVSNLYNNKFFIIEPQNIE